MRASMTSAVQSWPVAIPASRELIWESPFWVSLLYGSLMPATQVPRQEWFGIPMKYSDVLVLGAALFYAFGMLGRVLANQRASASGWLVVGTLCMVVAGGAGLAWGPLEGEDQLAMGYTLLLAASGPIQAAGLLAEYDKSRVSGFLTRLVGFMALLCLLYTAESVFNIGLRSEEGRNLGADFGIQRVRGPLFGPSTGYLILLPAIGWSLYLYFAQTKRRLWPLGLAMCFVVALLGLGSRAALILLVAFVLVLALMMKQLKKKILTVSVLATVTLGAGILIYGQADTQRLQSFEDGYRRTTHETALTILETEGVKGFLTGTGYGAIWSWYRRDALRGEWIAVGDNTIWTGYGVSLYHCHSTILEMVVEFGLLGVVWLVILVGAIAKLPGKLEGTAWKSFAWALTMSLGSFAFDLFLFKEVRVNCVWWLFVAGALCMAERSYRHTGVRI